MSGNWDAILTPDDRAVLARGRWAQRAGFGKRPALLLIDCQYYMAGIRGAPGQRREISACLRRSGLCRHRSDGAAAQRRRGRPRIPVFFTRYVVDPVNDDVGMFHRKIGAGVGRGDNLYFAGTHGAEIVADLKPLPNEIVIDKKRFSAFLRHAAALAPHRPARRHADHRRRLDLELHPRRRPRLHPVQLFHHRARGGGLRSPADFAHTLNLFDINRSYGDVVPVDEVLAYLATVAP